MWRFFLFLMSKYFIEEIGRVAGGTMFSIFLCFAYVCTFLFWEVSCAAFLFFSPGV